MDKEAFDRSSLIYGIGHAFYSLSDPRAQIFKRLSWKSLPMKKAGKPTISSIPPLSAWLPRLSAKQKIYKGASAPALVFLQRLRLQHAGHPGLYTPMFAMARIVGWSAHRIEELIMDKIIHPAYKSIMKEREYVPMEQR